MGINWSHSKIETGEPMADACAFIAAIVVGVLSYLGWLAAIAIYPV